MVQMIDYGVQMKDIDVIKYNVILMLVFTIMGYLASLTCQTIASNVGQKVAGSIREDLFLKTQEFNLEDFRLFDVDGLMNRFTVDVEMVQDMIAKTIRLAVRAPILMVGSLFAMYKINPMLAMTLLKSFPLMIFITIVFMRLSLKYHRRSQKNLDDLLSKSNDTVSGMRIVRAYNQENKEQNRFRFINELLKKSQRVLGRIASFSSPVTNLTMNFVLVLLIYQGAFQIQDGLMTQGQMIAIINYCTQLVLSFIVFMNLVLIFSRGVVSSGRIEEVLNYEIERQYGNKKLDVSEGISIEFVDVNFSDPVTNRTVLKNINLHLDSDENLGIFGLTGSGKTSLMHLITRHIEATSGQIYINHEKIETYDLKDLRTKINFVSQEPLFLEKTLKENIQMSYNSDPKQALLQAGGKDILAKGLDVTVSAFGSNFSGGQRQRIHLSRAFVKESSLLILDDSLGGLDNQTANLVFNNILKTEKQQKIVISQKFKELSRMDRIICLEDGEIVDNGTADQLLKTNENFALMFELQGGGELES